MSTKKLAKMLRKLEQRYDEINPKCKLKRSRILKKAESVQRKLEELTE